MPCDRPPALPAGGTHGAAARAQDDRDRRGHRLVDGRSACLWYAAGRRVSGAPFGSGFLAGDILAAPCGAGRSGNRRALCAAQPHPRRTAGIRSHRLAALRGSGGRLRIWLQPCRTQDAGFMGGAVRRFRQQRAGHHRSVHRFGRDEMAAHVGPRFAAAPWL